MMARMVIQLWTLSATFKFVAQLWPKQVEETSWLQCNTTSSWGTLLGRIALDSLLRGKNRIKGTTNPYLSLQTTVAGIHRRLGLICQWRFARCPDILA
jgi:hypothetical protein